MKKLVVSILCMMIFGAIFADDYKLEKLHEFENKKENGYLFIRSNDMLGAYEDVTGNSLKIDSDGKIYVYQEDTRVVYTLDTADYSLKNRKDFGLFPGTAFLSVDKGLLGFQVYENGVCIIDEQTGKKIVDIENLSTIIRASYYSKENNVFLYVDYNSAIHSIINPGVSIEENKKNYKTPDQTIRLFSKNSEYGKKGLLIEDDALYINGVVYYWYGIQVNGYMFYTSDAPNIYLFKNNELIKTMKVYSENEQLESVAVHPCGDIYILRMNWQTNKHCLYRIENTWDPEWRTQWYKEHSIK
ncbi:hypothetical protein SAMN04487977_102393 [Treponema bryantii]|uniref:WG containing repeat-containing protein n=1 Tax=Treponema bryantii TaxID=163 RepID=A0A1H9D1A7_9SPIR|nr:hypothetical protein [Treponema bryantii]SEQ07250.1 hypothetical protein SAMN04487977_102393 [Treponema bryantii]